MDRRGGLKFLGFRLHEDGTFHSETRKGIVGQINWKFLELYDPTKGYYEKIKVIETNEDVESIINEINNQPHRD